MTQVLDNIIINAYKYAHTSIDISFWETETNLCMKIKDYGMSLQKVDYILLFQKFYRGSNVDGKSGSELGLFLAKQFVEGMGGVIFCEKDSGFSVTLTLKKAGVEELRIG